MRGMEKKGGLAMLLDSAEDRDEDEGYDEEESTSSDEEYVAAEDLLSAIRSKDVDGVAAALRAFVECCMSEDRD